MINEKKVPDEIAINLCELIGRSSEDMHSWIERLIIDTSFGNCSRIYLGSYYCDHYFLQTSVSRYTDVICFAREREIKITLVIPPLFETNLEKGISLAEKLISEGRDLIDEVTINDWGMLQYFSKVSNVKINMGRLLQKDNRDPRYIEFFNETHTHRCFSGFYKQMLSTNNVSCVELDCTHGKIYIPDLLSDIKVAVHGAWTYMSLGSICLFASMNKSDNRKFRYADICSCECNNMAVKMNCDDITLYRFGRSIQFKNDNCKIISEVPYRYIYSPFNELIKEM